MRCFIGLALVIVMAASLTLGGCGGSRSSAKPAPDFTLNASPAALSVTGGGAGQNVSVTATAINGFSGQVMVTLSGLPSGVTATPASLTLSAGAAQNIALTASANVATAVTTVTLTGSSGTLAHTASILLTTTAVAALPDFTLAVTPASQTLVRGTAGTPLSVQAAGMNGFSAPVEVSITGLPAGVTASPASLNLTPGTAQNVTLTATQGAALGTSTVSFTGTSGALTHAAALMLAVQAAAVPDVTTYHYNNARDGLNAQESVLTPANVSSASFGKVGFFAADGKVDAQPLYLAGLSVNGTVTNVVYMATEHDSLYAINADTGATVWQTSVLGADEQPSDDHGCGQVTPEIGITSTPVIDRAKGAIFLVGMSKDVGGKYHHRLHALSLTTGAELSGSPVEITGIYPGTGVTSTNGNVIFDPGQYEERQALLLLNGKIYLGWASHCDIAPYLGWIMAYDENTLAQSAILNLTPNGSEGSVWMSGAGMTADAAGFIYVAVANGTFDTTLDSNGLPINHDYGNTILKLSTGGGLLAPVDYFTPWNTVAESNADLDVGSGGLLLMPDLTDASGTARHLAVAAGKDKHMYIVDRDNMGKINQKTQDNSNAYEDLTPFPNGTFSMGAFFNNTLYYGSNGDVLKAFLFVQAKTTATPSSTSPTGFPYPGTTPAVSANGTQNAIVWAAETPSGGAGVLHAYDATNLSRELYNSNQAAGGRDNFTGNKFIAPVVVNGKVLVGTPTGVAVFGLLPATP